MKKKIEKNISPLYSRLWNVKKLAYLFVGLIGVIFSVSNDFPFFVQTVFSVNHFAWKAVILSMKA
jgi:hypothetical protein